MEWNIGYLTVLSALAMLLIGLVFTVFNDPYISRTHRRIMLIILALSAALIAQNYIEDYLSAGPPRQMLQTAVAVFGYAIRPVFLILFLCIVRPDRKHAWAWCLAGVNLAIYMTAFFSRICFWISEENHFRSTPLSNACLVISLVLLTMLLYQSVRNYQAVKNRSLFLPCIVVLMILAADAMDGQGGTEPQPVTFLTVSIIVSTVFYYIWLHLQYVREHEEDLRTRQRVQIMLSQIQPHFLYNALGAIQYLCTHDPVAAAETTRKFTRYLQGNINSLSESGMIPFTQELEHTKIYLEIEQIRYGNALRVVYDIACTDFTMPALTLQPIVENAVRHGARGVEQDVGTVTLATREYTDRYEITVSDEGPGFDPEHIKPPEDGRAHIGISNVRERIERVCGGMLRYQSKPGEGAVAMLTIPKRREERSC